MEMHLRFMTERSFLDRSRTLVVAFALAIPCLILAQEQPAPPTAPAETSIPKEITFNFSEVPWEEVARWLADIGQKSLLVEAKPEGTFTYFDKRKYTFPEALDVINSVLLTKGHVLLVRNNFLILADLKEGIPPHRVEYVEVADLPTKGRTELVKVLLTLKGLVAAEAKKEFESMSSPHGKIINLDSTNQLLIVDTAQTVQQIVDLIQELEGDQGSADLRAFPLKHVSARDIERVVRDLLGLPPRETQSAAAAAPGAQAPDFGRGGRRGGDDDDRRERFQQMVQQFMGNQGGGQQGPQGQGRPQANANGPFVSVDERTNTLFVTATPDKLALVGQVVARLDVPQEGGELVEQTPRIEVYPIAAGDAEGLASVLQSVFDTTADLKVTAHPDGRALIVYATPRDHERLKSVLAQIKSEGLRVEVIPLRVLDATTTATLVQALLGQKQDDTQPRFRFSFFDRDGEGGAKAGPSIEADIERNRLVVRGTESQIAEIRGLLVKLGETGLAAGSAGGRYRVVPLAGQDPAELAKSVERIWKQLGTETPIRVEVLGTPSTPGPKDSEDPKAEPAPPEQPSQGDAGDRSIRRAADVRLVNYQQEPEKEKPAEGIPESKPGAPVTIVVGPDNIAVFSDDLQALDMVENLLNSVVRGQQTSAFAYYYLKVADAQEVSYLLDEALYGEKRQTSVFFQEPENKNRARILPDLRSNAILVVGPPAEQRKVQQLLEVIDSEDRPDTNATQRPYVIPVQYSDANQIATVVREVFAAQLYDSQNRNQRGNVPNLGMAFGGFGMTQPRQSRVGENLQGKLTVGVDEKTNSIVVAAPAEIYREVENLVRTLDESARTQGRAARVVTLKNTNPQVIEQALGNLFGVRTTAELEEERRQRARVEAEENQERREERRNPNRRNRDVEDALRNLGNQQLPGFMPRPFFPF